MAAAQLNPPSRQPESPGADAPCDFQGLANLAFGSLSRCDGSAADQHLALLRAESLELDLGDPAQRRFGDYELLERIGEGGMGVVYRARHLPLDREVAVKLLSAGPWASREFIARFEREARNTARMQHPNIVTVFETGSHEGLHFIAMRLVEGRSLSAALKRGQRLVPREAAALMRTVAEALFYAHRLGVLHLDLKPGNVLIGNDGIPYVADFGLARRLGSALATDNDEVSGTPAYMAPEQARVRDQKLTVATDVWGLGAILYELLTGRPPFRADTAQAMLELVREACVPAPRRLRPTLSRDLQAITLRCLARDPAERYPTARALADDLGRFLERRPVDARPLHGPQRLWRWARREPMLATAVACATAALVVGFAISTMQWRRADANAQAAVVARDDALRRQTQAEEILEFMLGDLRKRLSRVGRLDLLRSVDDRAAVYFATLNPRDLTDTVLEQQARLLTDVGQVRLAEGKLAAAVAAFREALSRSSALYAHAPGNGNRLFDKAQAEYWIGVAAMQQGDYATAEGMLRRYHASTVRLAAMDHDNFQFQKELAYGLQALAVMDQKMGRTALAERGMQEQRALYRDWLRRRPSDPQLRFEAANVVSWLGNLALGQGRFEVAESYFSEQVEDLERNMAAEPANADWKAYSVDALAWLGDVRKQRGRLADARASLASSAELAAVLYVQDPENNDWRTALALSRVRQAELDAVDQPRKAIHEARAAETLLVAARAKDPRSLNVRTGLVRVHNQLAQLALARGDPGTAARDVTASLALVEPVWKDKPNESLRLLLAQTRLLEGEIARHQGRHADARRAWNEARELLVSGAKPEVAFARLDPLVRALQWLGLGAEAAPHLQRLTAAGYVPLQHWPGAPNAPAARVPGSAGVEHQ